MRITRTARRRLWSAPARTLAEAVRYQHETYTRAVTVVRIFYAASLFVLVQSIGQWSGYLDAELLPQWPARWLDWVGADVGVPLILGAYAVSGVLVAAVPWRRSVRLAYFVTFLQYLSLYNGFGKVNHGFHAWLFLSGILVLLPKGPWTGRRRLVDQRTFVAVVWTGQLCILFFYTLTGFWKAHSAVTALWKPEMSSFQIDGFSYILAHLVGRQSMDALLVDVVLDRPLLGWALFNGTMYLEAASILVAFRPRLHRLWGLGLIGFHMGTALVMGINFPIAVLLVGILFLVSPFAPERFDLREVVLDLPGVHLLTRLRQRVRSGGLRPSGGVQVESGPTAGPRPLETVG